MTTNPAPFCGGEAEVERFGHQRASTVYSCTECGCRLETGEESNHGKRWNERALSPTPDHARLMEALRSATELVEEAIGRGLSEWDAEAAERLPELRAALASPVPDAVPDIASPAGEDELVSWLWQEARRKAIARQGVTTNFVMPDEAALLRELEGKAAALITSQSQEIERMREGLRDIAGRLTNYPNGERNDRCREIARELAGKDGE